MFLSLDVLMLDTDQQTVSVYLWSHEDFAFQQSATFRHNAKVINIVPGDFTHSGKLDLLVMSQSRASGLLDMSLYPALPGGGFGNYIAYSIESAEVCLDVNNPISLPSSSLSQPIPIDLNGDMRIDLLGSTVSSPGTLQAWQNVWNASQPRGQLFNVYVLLRHLCLLP